MTRTRFILAAALLTGAALPALAVDTKPVVNGDTASVNQATDGLANKPGSNMPSDTTTAGMPARNADNAQAGISDNGTNAAPNTLARNSRNNQVAMNTTSTSSMSISSDPSSTERKATHTAAARRAADRAEAKTTKELNQQAAEEAKPDSSTK